MTLVDTHAHLDHEEFNADREEVIARAKENGVGVIVTTGYDIPSSEWACKFAKQHEEIYAIIGVHPHDAKDASPDMLERIRALAASEKVLAIGEIGLDYHYDLSPRDVQRQAFISQIRLARELRLPVVIHDREAHGDVMDIIRDEKAGEAGGILHCFSGSIEMARECIKRGFYISFAGPLTFNRAPRLKEIAALLPGERILVETDCPYLAPVPRRGQRNEPAFVRYTAQELAGIRSVSLEEIAYITTRNALAVFAPRLRIPALS